MKQILKVFILAVIIISCDSIQRSDDSSVLQSENLIAYIENPSQRGANGLLMGQIVILDIDTQKKYYLKEKESYINNPVWLPNNKKLMYFTETEAYTDSDFPFGFKLGVDIFLFNIERQTNQILFPNLEKTNQKFYMMTHEINGANDSNTFIIPQIKNIYQIKTPNYEITKIIDLDSNYHISKIDLSPNNKYLIVNTSNSNFEKISEKYELLLIELENKKLKKIANTLNGGGWDIGSGNYIFRKRNWILNFNIKTNIIDTINIPVKYCSEIKYNRNSQIIGLGKEMDELTIPNEIFLYDVKNDNLDWLTDDKIFKENINVLL